MNNSDESVKINHNPKWYYISDQSYTILIIDSSGSGKINAAKTKRNILFYIALL